MLNSAFNRRRWLGGHRRGAADARQRGNPLRFINHGLVALWDAALGVTLNGADVSALADQVPWLPLSAPVAYDLSQATGANQPLYTGAPAYNGQPSIQFSFANTDNLTKLNNNFFGAGAWSVVSVQRMRNTTAGQQIIWESRNAGFTGGSMGIVTSVPSYRVQDLTPGGVNHDGGTPGTTAPEVTIFMQGAGAVPTALVNGAAVALSAGAGGQADPGGAAMFSIGSTGGGLSSDQDFLFNCLFTTAVPNGVAVRLSHALGARFGVAA